MSLKMTSLLISLNESNLSSSSGEMDFIFIACKLRQHFVCVLSDGEMKKKKSHGKRVVVAVDCKNRKYIPDRSLPSSLNKASGSFEQSNACYTAACLNLAGMTAGHEGWQGATQRCQHTRAPDLLKWGCLSPCTHWNSRDTILEVWFPFWSSQLGAESSTVIVFRIKSLFAPLNGTRLVQYRSALIAAVAIRNFILFTAAGTSCWDIYFSNALLWSPDGYTRWQSCWVWFK